MLCATTPSERAWPTSSTATEGGGGGGGGAAVRRQNIAFFACHHSPRLVYSQLTAPVTYSQYFVPYTNGVGEQLK